MLCPLSWLPTAHHQVPRRDHARPPRWRREALLPLAALPAAARGRGAKRRLNLRGKEGLLRPQRGGDRGPSNSAPGIAPAPRSRQGSSSRSGIVSAPPTGKGVKGLSLSTATEKDVSERQLGEFRDWLREGGVSMRGIHVRKVADRGLGLFAARDFREGETLFRVPRSLFIEVDAGQFSDISNEMALSRAASVQDADGPARKSMLDMARLLLAERRAGAASKQGPHLAVLPDPPPLWPLRLRWPAKLSAASELLQRLHTTTVERDEACMDELQSLDPVWKSRCWALCAAWTRSVPPT
eukprot:s1908_g2.t1